MHNLRDFRKLSILMASRYSGEHLRTDCVQKFFIEALNIEIHEIYLKLSKNDHFLLFLYCSQNFERNTIVN